jgi:general secretion pathway protein A
MFLQYYGMREQPFGVTPSPYDLYLSATHREALASLFYGVEAGRGFMALIAKPGMGKTTLLFRLLERLESSARTVFLFHTQCDSREFFGHLLADLGIDSRGHDVARMHDQLNQVLLAEARAGRRFVLVIDEAQNLDDSVLETVRLLSDFETPRAKLMHIILAGQPQLAEKLARPGLVQLRQRISLLARLEPFSLQETRAYIDHRLKAVGYVQPELFTPDAMEMIGARSEGIPRNINNICFNALSLGYALEKKKIDFAIVQEVLSDLNLGTLIEEPSAVPKTTLQTKVDVQELIEPGVQRGARMNARRPPALRFGVVGVAVFAAIWLLVFVMGKPKSDNNLSPSQLASASVSQTNIPSRANAEPADAKTLTHPNRSSGVVHPPLPSARAAVPRQSEENRGAPPVQGKPHAKARKDTREPSKVRKVPSPVPATTVLSSSGQPAGDATSAAVGSAGGGAPVSARADLRTYREAVQQSPMEPATHHNLAHALQATGDLNGAAAEYRQALRLGPTHAESHIGLASVLLEKGNFDGALAEFQAAARLKPDDPRAHYGAGLVLYAKGDPASLDNAMSEYREAIRLRPGDANVHYALGSALFQKQDFDAAISEYREALRLAPDRALVREQLGKALLQKGDVRQPSEN